MHSTNLLKVVRMSRYPLPAPVQLWEGQVYFKWAMFLIVLLAIALNFRSGFNYFFAQDDFLFLSRLAHVHNFGDALDLLLRNDHFYRPVSRVLMLGVPYALFGTLPAGYHVFGLGLHLVNSLLVYRLLRALKTEHVSSLLGMGIYGAYPAHFTSVVWISGIQDLALSFFVLLACLGFLAWCSKRSGVSRYLLAALCYLAALFCKETAFFLPVWFIAANSLIRFRPEQRQPNWARIFLWQIPFTFTALCYLLIRSLKADVTGIDGPYTVDLGLGSIWNNVQLYGLDFFGLSPSEFGIAGALIGVTIIGIVVAFGAISHARAQIAIGAVWIVVFMFPTAILSNRHYSYYFGLASVGVAIIVSAILNSLIPIVLKGALRYRLEWLLICGLLFGWLGYANYQTANQYNLDEQGLRVKGERAQQVVSDFQGRCPNLSAASTLYVVGLQKSEDAILGYGSLFTFFRPILNLDLVVLRDDNMAASDTPLRSNACLYRLPPKP